MRKQTDKTDNTSWKLGQIKIIDHVSEISADENVNKITDENAAVQNYTFSHMEPEVVVKDANEHDNKNDITALTQRRCGKKTKTISKL